ncbi:DUF481 domain-containing protein [Sphingomicrobium astaxanthinifaciens]|uniref:DUF481 domain-containing protein n=1 Tax=Sphingomicrobium astaxanthinifaciens TaxID=1227949 RepID=UPI001FCCB4C0|nr:DUF481 domain-containing protein [Sphingomicrobium astaxanthinifaciens]MCJ7420599.1 DUF481 domain-containing protein [Sphingomicrobium astaxanthinifaciens]
MTCRFVALAAAGLAPATPLAAAPPEGVAQLVEQAADSGDAQKLDTVLDLARAAYPGEAAAIASLETQARARLVEVTAAKAAKRTDDLRAAGLFDHWSGRGELGGYYATGSSEESGLSAGLGLERTGIDWRHAFRVHVDWRRSDGDTTREQLLAGYEPQYDVTDRLFTYGLVEGERDRTQGIDNRLSLSGGAGYRLFDRDTLQWSVKAGPAWRRTDWLDREDTSRLAGLAATTLAWQLNGRLALTQDADAYVQAGGNSYRSETGLEADLGGNLLARLAFRVDHESDPPADRPATDTLSRITLVYDFE